MRLWVFGRFRRSTIAVLVLATLLALGMASTVVAVDAYIFQSGGTAAYSYQGWYAGDQAAVSVENSGVFDLYGSVLASFAQSRDLGDVGTPALPLGTGVVTAAGGSKLYLHSTGIYSFGSQGFRGAQGVFATGAVVNLDGCTISGDEFVAHGLYTQKGGTIVAANSDITTNKAGDGAPVATGFDGGGTIALNSCQVNAWGLGAPALYSTGAITSDNSSIYSHHGVGAWIDGGYSLALTNASLYAYEDAGVSFAKSPVSLISKDDPSVFTMTGGYLESAGPLFYSPNSKATITLDHANAYSHAGVALTTVYTGQGPGGGQPSDTNTPGAREAAVTLNCVGSTLRGNVITNVDQFSGKNSVVTLAISNWGYLEGALNQASKGTVNLQLAHEADWEVTADSHVGALVVPTITSTNSLGNGLYNLSFAPDLTMIRSHGHIVFYDPLVNAALRFGTFRLPQGGWLMPESIQVRGGMRPGVQ